MGDWNNKDWKNDSWGGKKDDWKKDGGNDWKNDWNKDKKDDWKKDDSKDDWKKDDSKDDWKKDDWKKDDTAEASNGWGAKNDDWEDKNWTPPVDESMKCLSNMNKEWTKEAWEGAQKKKEEDQSNFYQYQKDNAESAITSRKTDWELDEEQNRLFGYTSASGGIDFDKYESIDAEVRGNKSEGIPIAKTFDELFHHFDFLPQAIMDNVRRCGYTKPTPVQKYAIPVALAGRDIVCCAQTGSGKTASFLIPIIGMMMKHHHNPIGSMTVPFEGECDPDTLILSPTRELCVQIYEEACKFTHRTPYRVVRIYGGEKPSEQIREICKGTDVLIATPGRLLDFISRGLIRLDRVRHLVIDEADRMMDMGFLSQVEDIVENHGMKSDKEGRHTMMFSATFSDEIQDLARKFLYDHIWVGIGRVGGAVDTVTQQFVDLTVEEKPDKLLEQIDDFLENRNEGEVGIVFCNSKKTCMFLDEYLWDKKVDVAALHGDLKQAERDESMAKIRTAKVDVLVATDIACRGLDIQNMALVINYDLPTEVDSYIHRIGRTGRIGNRGKAVSFITRDKDSGLPIENLSVLTELVNILNYTSNEVPEWLQPLIDKSNSAEMSKWGGRDARNGEFGSYDEREKPAWKADNGGDWWSNNNGADPWKKAMDGAKKEEEEPKQWNQDGVEQKGETEPAEKEEAAATEETAYWKTNDWSGGNNNWGDGSKWN